MPALVPNGPGEPPPRACSCHTRIVAALGGSANTHDPTPQHWDRAACNGQASIGCEWKRRRRGEVYRRALSTSPACWDFLMGMLFPRQPRRTCHIWHTSRGMGDGGSTPHSIGGR